MFGSIVFAKCEMSCIYRYRMMQNTFSVLKILWLHLFISSALPTSSPILATVQPFTLSMLLLCGHSVVSDSLQPQGRQHARLPCPSPPPGACSNSCPSSQWCHPTISSSVVPTLSIILPFLRCHAVGIILEVAF